MRRRRRSNSQVLTTTLLGHVIPSAVPPPHDQRAHSLPQDLTGQIRRVLTRQPLPEPSCLSRPAQPIRSGRLRVPFGWSEVVLSLCSNPVMHVVVTGALVENGAVLLVHRSPTRRAYPDLWDLPGGHVEAGESELQALAREMREELGVHIVAESSSRVGDWHAGSGEDAVHVGVWQIGDWVGSPTNRAPDEHDDIAWVGISELGGLPLAHGDLAALVRSLP
jgi:8-oxo-dGTP diphosphatase